MVGLNREPVNRRPGKVRPAEAGGPGKPAVRALSVRGPADVGGRPETAARRWRTRLRAEMSGTRTIPRISTSSRLWIA